MSSECREKYNSLVTEVTEKAQHMKDACIKPVLNGDGTFIMEKAARDANISAATKDTIFEGCGPDGAMVHATASNAIRSFCHQRGRMPSDDLLAAGYTAIQNVIGASGKGGSGLILESAAAMNTQDSAQAMMRNRMIALVLPTMLQSITSNIVGFIPGQFNQSEIFKVWRTAGATFGDLTKGDRIQWDYTGQYSSMDQRHLTIAGDGAKDGLADEFDFVSTTKWGAPVPFKKKRVRIIHDGNPVATDDGNGYLFGNFKVGATPVAVSGTVDYDNGVVHPVFSVAPANGINVHVAIDIDIEKAPQLIPSVNHEMDSYVVYPHESAITATTSLQALWGMRREFNLNVDNMATIAMKNLLAADKDRKHLKDLYFFMKGSQSWVYTIPETGVNMQDYYETLRTTLLSISSALLNANGVSGLVGIVADLKTCAILKSMRSPHFDPAPGYVQIPQPHYVGRLFGMWDLYEDPQRADYSSLCFAKGRNICEAAYIAGDAIPAIAFKHGVLSDLKYNNTLWELAYRDLQQFNGRDYIMELKLVAA